MQHSKLRNIHTFSIYGGFYTIFISIIMALFFPSNFSGAVFITATIAVLPSFLEYIVFPFKKMVASEISYRGEKEIENAIEKEQEILSAPSCLWISLLMYYTSQSDDLSDWNSMSIFFICISLIFFIFAFRQLFRYLYN